MRVRWFGSAWPLRGGPAPICDDLFKLPIEQVAGHKCVECDKPIKETSTGVVTACTASIWSHFWLEIQIEEEDDDFENLGEVLQVTVCAYHLHCWLAEVVGGVMSEKVLARMTGVGYAHLLHNNPPTEPDDLPVEDADIGKGWER